MKRAAALFVFLALPLIASAQTEGVWFGGGLGVGYADIDCARCGMLFDDDPWEGGPGIAGNVSVGRTFTPQLRAGAELYIWHRRDGEPERDATLVTIGIGGRFYPSENFFGSVGIGLGQSFLGGNGLIETPGLALGVGLGYDIYVGADLALSPFVRFAQIIGEGAEGRNRGEPAEGPDHPRFLQLGLSLFKY